jgi:hypothetical protein
VSNPTLYESLFAEALADVESGIKHPCKLRQDCQEARGCPGCISGAMKGDLGILSVDVFESGTLRITTVGHNGKPCVIAFRNVVVNIVSTTGESCHTVRQ